jgi:hypothetical protein
MLIQMPGNSSDIFFSFFFLLFLCVQVPMSMQMPGTPSAEVGEAAKGTV